MSPEISSLTKIAYSVSEWTPIPIYILYVIYPENHHLLPGEKKPTGQPFPNIPSLS